MKKNYVLILLTVLFTVSIQAQVVISQSVDPVSVTESGVACWSAPPTGTGEYRDNAFLRSYTMSVFGITEDFGVTSVEYGQGAADDGKLITVNLYTATSEDLTTATLTLIGTATHVSAAIDDLTLISVSLTATIPAGSIVALEVSAADGGTNVGETYFPGYNTAGENGISYLVSAGCGLTTPTPTADIGQAANQYVMNIVGSTLSVDSFTLDAISVAPNPATNYISINFPASISDFTTELYDITGKLVLKSSNKERLDVSQLQAGIYILRISTNDGTISKRITKS
ncbi:T9SS type A sorting domain-containing protein [Psychroserpens burtonensis]|uniref:T9SS type A sorting domain-containing protein n=1 Tax=Psychroserpens burtonensis TaxID=49278 RepID=A0A5C7BJ58_9FLAO|nr:T9SS type A sorting domain-containing protein [Psychroserpens burtonensis]TXE20021.1 T9SS type A sorting domain-containing protein [Psychroserpens burtonensis]